MMSGALAADKGKKRGGGATALLLSGTVSALALPSAVLAVSSGLEPQKLFKYRKAPRAASFPPQSIRASPAALPSAPSPRGGCSGLLRQRRHRKVSDR